MTLPQDRLREALADRYRIERELGAGGMATVYLAHDLRHDRQVAVKVLRPELAAVIGAERFLSEIRTTANLQHPHILPLFDSGVADSFLYYVMPYVRGISLRERLTKEKQLPIAEAVRIAREIAGALDYAHRNGVIHRDVKPENILLHDGSALMADFGIALAASKAGTRMTETGMSLGTPQYMSPEQAMGEREIDARSDVYALGCVTYEMLTGEPPFSGPTAQAIVARVMTTEPADVTALRKTVPPHVSDAVRTALQKLPADRFGSTREFALALADASGGGRSPGPPAVPLRRSPSRRPWMIGSALLAVIALALAVIRIGRSPDGPADRSIAVLPFANTSGNAADDPLFDGITDELIGTLGSVRALRVVGRTSVFALKGRALDARVIGDTLGVATVLEGSGRREGNRLKVRVQLVNTADGRVLWADAYDREGGAALAVQEAIAREIVAALRVELGASSARLVRTATEDSAAYELYLRGRYVFNTDFGPDGVRSAVRHFEDAIRRDSTLAPAWAGLSDARARLAIFGYGEPLVEMPLARVAALRALALDGTLAAAHASLGHVLCIHELDWAAGERSFRRAIAEDPGYIFARLPFAVCLSAQRRFGEAIAQLDSARVSDPLAPVVPNLLGRIYVSAGKPDSAIAVLRQAISLDPRLDLAHQQLGHAYVQKGMYDEAIAALERAAALSGPRDSAHLAWAHAVAGHRAEAEQILASVLSRPERQGRLAVHAAMAYAALGDRDAAFALLERSFRERSSFLAGIGVTPALAPLHADPRWAALLQRMGLRAEP
ncbi:MAG TPA: protein kinase [Gemmatimonadales bacterium]|nr:protein kinase [Gemmatimonadales bacterium]